MFINRAQLKADARLAMKESKTSPYVVTFVYVVITYLLSYLSIKILRTDELIAALESSNLDFIYSMNEYAPSFLDNILVLLLDVMGVMLSTGFIIFALNAWRRRETSLGNLFDGFSILLRVIVLRIVTIIFIFLWSLLFIIPGIIASIRYSRAIYLLIDHPEMSIISCISESSRLMKGRKSEFFMLQLSFLGWMIISSTSYSVSPLLSIGSAIISIFVIPYMEVSYAGWHDTVLLQDKHQDNTNDRYGDNPYYNNNDDR